MCEKFNTSFFYFEGFPKELTPLTELKSAWQRPECQHKVDPVGTDLRHNDISRHNESETKYMQRLAC